MGVSFLIPGAFFGSSGPFPLEHFSVKAASGQRSPCLAAPAAISAIVPSLANVTQKREATGHIIEGHLLLSATFITPACLHAAVHKPDQTVAAGR